MTRIARIIGGFALLFAGILMLALPGPGILSIVAGLALLATEFHWAGRLRDWVKEKFVGSAEEPAPPNSADTPPSP